MYKQYTYYFNNSQVTFTTHNEISMKDLSTLCDMFGDSFQKEMTVVFPVKIAVKYDDREEEKTYPFDQFETVKKDPHVNYIYDVLTGESLLYRR